MKLTKRTLSLLSGMSLALGLAACSNMPEGLEAKTDLTTQTQVATNKQTNTPVVAKDSLRKPLATKDTPSTDIQYLTDGSNFGEFRQFLIEQARLQGFSERVLTQLEGLTFNQKVVNSDRSQYERILANRRASQEKQTQDKQNTDTASSQENDEPVTPATPSELNLMQTYINRHISNAKVDRAVALLNNYDFALTKISRQFNVPKEVIVGLWGMESNFGANQGSYDLLDALASLAYEGRRRAFFTREFFNALRVMEINKFDKSDMKSSWAGAMGQIQFMPTSYLVYGADGSDDGQINIWLSTLDAFASTANYLKTEGWDGNLPWGLAVHMDMQEMQRFKDLIGTTGKSRSLKEWLDLGIILKGNQEQDLNYQNVKPNTQFWLMVPTNEPKMAYLVTKNYSVYMHWNRSSYFAYTNGMFASLIHQKYTSQKASSDLPVTGE